MSKERLGRRKFVADVALTISGILAFGGSGTAITERGIRTRSRESQTKDGPNNTEGAALGIAIFVGGPLAIISEVIRRSTPNKPVR